jgi:hypothetical protein
VKRHAEKHGRARAAELGPAYADDVPGLVGEPVTRAMEGTL